MKFTLATALALASAASAAPIIQRIKRQAPDTGSCGSPEVIFAVGLDGRKEAAFQPANLVDFGHGSANNIDTITDFICQRLDSPCKAPQATLDACQQGRTAAASKTGQAAADAFNAALGVYPECGEVYDGQDDDEDDSGDDGTDDGDDGTDDGTGDDDDDNCNGALDLGICTDPTMSREAGRPGRKADEFVFFPTNSDGHFGGQSDALNPAIIANFICDTFINRCNASQDALATCRAAQADVAAADAAGQRDQAVADAFNRALGF